MRKALLAATAIATMFTATSAMNVGLDIKGGLNIANQRGEAYEGAEDYQKAKLGAVAGIGAQLGLTDMFAIQPEVLFSMKGTKMEMSEGEITAESSLKLSYLNVPVLFKLNIPVGKVTPNVYAGPDFGINLAASYDDKVEGAGEDFDYDESVDVKEDVKGFDFNIAFGGGADFNISEKGRIILDLRYSLGLSDINAEEVEGYDAKNGAFGLMIGYGINF